jgi:hypothetical protein
MFYLKYRQTIIFSFCYQNERSMADLMLTRILSILILREIDIN